MSRLWVTKSSKQKEEVIKGAITPPVAYQRLIDAYYNNAYHASCIDVKAINILGNGIKDQAIIKKLTELSKKDSVYTLLGKTIKDLRIFGNAFWETPKDEIYHIPAWTMYKTENGWEQMVGKEKQSFKEDEIWQFKLGSMSSSFYGSPDYLSILGTIDLMGTITTYNNKFFENNAIPDFAIIVEGGSLSPEAENNIARFLRSKFRGIENSHKTLYLPVPMDVKVKFEKLQSDTKDMQFMELRKACIGEIISCHGIPPRLMSITVPGELGGGGESEGEKRIFFETRIKPEQNLFAGQLDDYFNKRLGMITDIEFEAFDYTDSTAEAVIKALK